MPKPLTRAQVAELCESVKALVEAIRRDEMTVAEPTLHRLEGALVGLEVALGRGEEAVQALLAAGWSSAHSRGDAAWG